VGVGGLHPQFFLLKKIKLKNKKYIYNENSRRSHLIGPSPIFLEHSALPRRKKTEHTHKVELKTWFNPTNELI
jgi:hypothetical protein